MPENEIQNMHERLDKQEGLLREIRDMLVWHLATEKEMKPALDELVAMWKGSKVIFGIIAGGAALGAIIWNAFAWMKDHLK